MMERSLRLVWTATALVGLLGAVACGEADAGRDADPTTAALLSSTIAPSGTQSTPGAPPSLARPNRRITLDELGYDVGDPDAPVKLIEFSDFGCGYCRRFHEEVWPVLEREYVATGKVYWKYVPMILGIFPNAMEAAQAGECAGEQGRFREMQGRLFADQSAWKGSGDAEAALEAIAVDVGLDMPRWRQCVADGVQDDRIRAGTQVSQQAGVRGTPTFFVVGYAPIPGALPLELFREVLDTAHAAAVRGDGPGAQ
jgi:protein-disulfide isomerase